MFRKNGGRADTSSAISPYYENSNSRRSVALLRSEGCLQFHLHRVHENRRLMPDLVFVHPACAKTFGEGCHFGAPEAVCLVSMKGLKSLCTASDVGGASIGGELQQGHAISVLAGRIARE
jgi:hypothetical protein